MAGGLQSGQSAHLKMAELSEISPRELKARIERGERPLIVDVREIEEVKVAPFPDALHIAMGEITSRRAELEPERETIVVCHHGIRSAQVAAYLSSLGFERVLNLSGGIDAWSLTVDSTVPRY
jgi:rhodanese-related sulfurtransferase